MTNKTDEELEIETSSRKRLIEMHTREEKKDIYMMVAKASISTLRPGEISHTNDIISDAEDIYQGMVKFCGVAK